MEVCEGEKNLWKGEKWWEEMVVLEAIAHVWPLGPFKAHISQALKYQ